MNPQPQKDLILSVNESFCALALSFTRQPCYQMSFLINGSTYRDGNSGATLFPAGVSAVMLEFAVMGISAPAGQKFEVIIRAYGSKDVEGTSPVRQEIDLQNFADSIPATYTVPTSFKCGGAVVTKPIKTHGKP